ncbi:hypothetical protein Tco_1447393 [Tanacetum coccineum]
MFWRRCRGSTRVTLVTLTTILTMGKKGNPLFIFKLQSNTAYSAFHHEIRVTSTLGGLPDLIAEGFESARMLISTWDAPGSLERQFDLDTPGALQFQLGGARRRQSWRQFIVALGLHMGEEDESPPIYVDIDDTWAWVAIRLERQPDAVAGAPGVAKDAPAIDEGDQAILEPMELTFSIQRRIMAVGLARPAPHSLAAVTP